MNAIDGTESSILYCLKEFIEGKNEELLISNAPEILPMVNGKFREIVKEFLGEELFAKMEKAAGRDYSMKRLAIDKKRDEARTAAPVSSELLQNLVRNAPVFAPTAEGIEQARQDLPFLRQKTSELRGQIKAMKFPVERLERAMLTKELQETEKTLKDKERTVKFGAMRVLTLEILDTCNGNFYPAFILLPLEGSIFRVELHDDYCHHYVITATDNYNSNGEYYPRPKLSASYEGIMKKMYDPFFKRLLADKKKEIRNYTNNQHRNFNLTTGVSAKVPASLHALVEEAKSYFQEIFWLVPTNWTDEATTDRMTYFATGKGLCVAYDGNGFIVLGDFNLSPFEQYI